MVPLLSVVDGGENGENEGGIIWYGGHVHAWKRLGVNLIGLLAIMVWSLFWSFLIFGVLKLSKVLRINEETEYRGNDVEKHGEAAYPMDAWVLSHFANVTSTEAKATCPDASFQKS